jgi:tetratricopeptide (TPR) repeat protein
LETDSEFKKEFDNYSVLVEGINMYERERMKNILKSTFNAAEGSAKHIDQHSRISMRRIYYAAAATLILLMIPGYFVYQNMTFNSRMYNEFYMKDPGVPVVMGSTNNSAFNNAMIEYKDANYKTALALFNQLRASDNYNDTLNFYSGLCYLETDYPEKAVDLFKKVTESETSYYYYPANYYLGLTYVRLDQISNATVPLKTVSGSSHYLNAKAKELLQELD